jgi:hypothetical protein
VGQAADLRVDDWVRHAVVAEDTPLEPSRNRTVIVSSVQIPSLGRTTKTGRHRPVALEDDPQAPGRELEDYLAALAPDIDVETTGSGRRFGNAQVYQLRLQLTANEQLRELAAMRGTSPQALAQEWLVQRLNMEAEQYAGAAAARYDAPAWPR